MSSAVAHDTGTSAHKRKRVQFSHISDRDVAYASHVVLKSTADAKYQLLDVYVPGALAASRGHDAPVVVFLHGGGLVQGDKSKEVHVAKAFTAHGYVVVVPNYRLAPDVAYSECARDAATALDWVRTHIDEYGGDAHNVTLVGFSAGAYLAALVAFDCSTYFEADASADGARPTEHPRIRRLVLLSGFYHVERVAPERDARIWGSDATAWAMASPVAHVATCAPLSTLIVYGDGDTPERQQESRDLHAALVRHWPASPPPSANKSVDGDGDGDAHVPPTAPRLIVIADRTHSQMWCKMAAHGDETVASVTQWIAATR